MKAPSPSHPRIRLAARCARWAATLALVSPVVVTAQTANEDSAALDKVRGTVYVRDVPPNGPANEKQCGFDFLVIARDPADGHAVQLKGRFLVSQDDQGAIYGWSGVLYDGLRPRQAGYAPGRIALQPVNGMRVKQLQPLHPASGDTLQYREPVDADFQVLLASIVRDRSLKLVFSRESDGAPIEAMLDMDVSAMQLADGKVSRQFESRVPAHMSRCLGGSGS